MAPACSIAGGAARLHNNTALSDQLPCLHSHSLLIRKIIQIWFLPVIIKWMVDSNISFNCYGHCHVDRSWNRDLSFFRWIFAWYSCKYVFRWKLILWRIRKSLISQQLRFVFEKRKLVLATNSDILIPISLQHDVVKTLIFKQINSVNFKCQRFSPSACKDIGIEKLVRACGKN